MVRNVMVAALALGMLLVAAGAHAGEIAWGDEEISPAEYGGLLALREIFPSDEYRSRVLPLLREAFVDGKVTKRRLHILGEKLGDVGARTLKALEEERTRDKMSRAWDSAREGAAALGDSLGDAMRDIGDAVDGLKPRRAPEPEVRNDGSVEL